jgi:two-component system alkaline phosphatase synthesis response regulator PhoP
MILKVLAEREGQVIWRDEILERVWGDEPLPSTRTIDNFIVRLRKRFEPDPEQPRFFHTVRGVGYRFSPKGEGSG